MDIAEILRKPEFPRSAKYDSDWMIENQMGPNAIWLMEWLCNELDLRPGMRVLDLGCGKAMTSIFLAREFGAQVWATDLWMSPDPNWRRAVEAGVSIWSSPSRPKPMLCRSLRAFSTQWFRWTPSSTSVRMNFTSTTFHASSNLAVHSDCRGGFDEGYGRKAPGLPDQAAKKREGFLGSILPLFQDTGVLAKFVEGQPNGQRCRS